MITFEREDGSVKMQFDTELGTRTPIFPFTFSLGEDHEGAELLLRHIRDLYYNRVEQARQMAYRQGYKDGRGKKRKRDCFSTTLMKRSTDSGCY